MSESVRPSTAKPSITDSPWFWVMLFCAFGVVFLLAIWPQYRARQRRLEMQFMAREEIVRRQAAGESSARAAGEEGDARPPTPGELIIPLWPLVLLLAALVAFSATMLWRSRRRVVHSAGGPGPGERV
jgi:hypothetical protein